MRKQIAQNKRNTVITILVFVVFIAAIAGIFAWVYQSPTILITAGIISVVYALIQYFFADKLALKSTGARQIEQVDNPRYYKIVQQLADENSLPMRKYILWMTRRRMLLRLAAIRNMLVSPRRLVSLKSWTTKS